MIGKYEQSDYNERSGGKKEESIKITWKKHLKQNIWTCETTDEIKQNTLL